LKRALTKRYLVLLSIKGQGLQLLGIGDMAELISCSG